MKNKGPFEIVIVDDSTDRTSEIVSRYPVTLIRAEGKNISEARNIGIASTRGELIAFTDDDCEVPPWWLSEARRFFLDDKVGAVGGPNLTPKEATLKERCAGLALASWFGSGISAARYSTEKETAKYREVDESKLITCNLFLRREALEQIGLFDPNQVPCEENELLHRMKEESYRLLYVPSLYVLHKRRPILVPFARQIQWYGIGRGVLTRRAPRSFKIVHVIPSLFVLGLLSGPLLALLHSLLRTIYLSSLALYLGLLVAASVQIVTKERERPLCIPIVMAAISLIHMAYGVGFLRGLSVSVTVPKIR